MEGLAAWGVKTGEAGQQGVGDGRSGPLGRRCEAALSATWEGMTGTRTRWELL